MREDINFLTKAGFTVRFTSWYDIRNMETIITVDAYDHKGLHYVVTLHLEDVNSTTLSKALHDLVYIYVSEKQFTESVLACLAKDEVVEIDKSGVRVSNKFSRKLLREYDCWDELKT